MQIEGDEDAKKTSKIMTASRDYSDNDDSNDNEH